jgi:hypothetical protein
LASCTRYRCLPPFLRALREEAGLTVYDCETANRRVDLTEFIAWTKACNLDPRDAFARFLELS